jgi:hypothetical protein
MGDGGGLSLLGNVFKGVLASLWLGDAALAALGLAFVSAVVAALVKRPRGDGWLDL